MKAPRANQTTLLRTAAGGQYDDESAEEQPPTQSAASPHFNERGTDRCQKVEFGVLEAVLEPVLESVQNKSRLGYLRIATASGQAPAGRTALLCFLSCSLGWNHVLLVTSTWQTGYEKEWVCH